MTNIVESIRLGEVVVHEGQEIEWDKSPLEVGDVYIAYVAGIPGLFTVKYIDKGLGYVVADDSFATSMSLSKCAKIKFVD